MTHPEHAAIPGHVRLQLNEQGQLRHFLSTDGLPRELLTAILDNAAQFVPAEERAVRKLPLLRGKTIVNLFFEPSTRTRTTFELAAKRLSADVLNIDIGRSSTSKGETLMDMLWNLEAMAVRRRRPGPDPPDAARTGAGSRGPFRGCPPRHRPPRSGTLRATPHAP